MFSDELNRRLQAAGKRFTALAVHPGGSDSGLFGDMEEAERESLKKQMEQFLHSNADAAKPSLLAALSPDVAGGDYYGPTGPQEMSGPVGRAIRNPISDDHSVAERLWTVSEEMTGQRFTI